MRIARTAADVAEVLEEEAWRASREVRFVPTMGALHDGHRALMKSAHRDARGACVVLSIFVNPLQFGPTEDFDRYPRDEESDLQVAQEEGADLVFLPSVEEMYPEDATTQVSVGPIGDVLEGASRPGHFDGVATVVAKLFNIVRPDIAYFGQKDAQQLAVIRSLVTDLNFPITIEAVPIVREPDGLALSSRNVYLTPDGRREALSLYRSLRAGAHAMQEEDDPEAAAKEMWRILSASDEVIPDYAVAVDPDDMGTPSSAGPVLLAVAARVGETRLIDNMLIQRDQAGPG